MSVLLAFTIFKTQVYALIHLIRVDVTSHIDTPLTTDQLLAPDSTYTIVRQVLSPPSHSFDGLDRLLEPNVQTSDGEIRLDGEPRHQ
jgi:hypothetical protein